MSTIQNSLSSKIDEYISLINVLCKCYDDGNDIVALSIATAIRVLIHDTNNSTSLLEHLNRKNGKFLSTNKAICPTKHVHLGLVREINVGVNDGKGGEAKYWPQCDERYFHSLNEHFVMLDFDEWWDETIFQTHKYSLSRKDLVLAIVNKDGGAHFDSKVQQKYDAFRKQWSSGSSLVGNHSKIIRGYDNIPTYPAIRQIAYEILNSKF